MVYRKQNLKNNLQVSDWRRGLNFLPSGRRGSALQSTACGGKKCHLGNARVLGATKAHELSLYLQFQWLSWAAAQCSDMQQYAVWSLPSKLLPPSLLFGSTSICQSTYNCPWRTALPLTTALHSTVLFSPGEQVFRVQKEPTTRMRFFSSFPF